MKRLVYCGAALALAAAMAACVSQPPVDRNGVEHVAPTVDKERSASVNLELAGMYLSRGQAQTALDKVAEVLAIKPDLPQAYDVRGLAYASLGDAAKAEQSFQRAHALAPTSGGIMHNYAWFLCQEKRYAEAEAEFNLALSQPTYRDATRTLLAQGICQARAGNWDLAGRTLLQSYQLDPTNPVTAFNLSDVLLHQGEYDRARFYVGRINANRDQSSAQSLWLAARVEQAAGKAQAARDLGRQLVDRFPKSPEALRFEAGKFDD
jgi:type IV pilus assembly protein PilF